MSNAVYTKSKDKLLKAQLNLSTATLKVALVKNTYSPNLATDEFLTAIATHVANAAQPLANVTVSGGVLDADDVTFTAVAADTVKALVIYVDTGVAGTSSLLAYIDQVPGFPFTGNGSDAEIRWDNGAGRILAL